MSKKQLTTLLESASPTKGLSGKRFEREVASNVEKAVSRAGVRDYVNNLPRWLHHRLHHQHGADLQVPPPSTPARLGYPVMADTTGPLVLSGGSQDNIRSLANRYDITFSFGTSGAGTAKQLNVPGVYATVDYICNASNPYIAPQATPSPYSLSGLRPEPTPAHTWRTQQTAGAVKTCITYGPMKNAPFDIKDAAGMTEAERQAALRQYQTEQFALRQAEQARRDAEVAAESARHGWQQTHHFSSHPEVGRNVPRPTNATNRCRDEETSPFLSIRTNWYWRWLSRRSIDHFEGHS